MQPVKVGRKIYFDDNDNAIAAEEETVISFEEKRRSMGGNNANKELYKKLRQKANTLRPHREALPIYSAREQLIKEFHDNDTVVLVGETGSGKTTQIPQYLLESGFANNGAIAVTQPRRVAATSLARRVSEEVGTKLGNKVGYTVRFDDTSSPNTLIKYLTDGMLIRELLSDTMLSRYSCVILDEAHERTLRTDILFGMVKELQKKRLELSQQNEQNGTNIVPLKIIIMSATLDAERFSEYFNNAKILYISGRQHSVRIFNTVEPQSDYLDSALLTIFQIHLEQQPGDILVFLTGQEEIESMEKLINEHGNQLPVDSMKLLSCPIFAALPPAQQAKVFAPAPPNTRKVILATNIAETSITISGIRYVIDTGLVKVRGYNSKIGIESLLISPISKSSSRQRTGRAGREAPGICYRLYTESTFDSLDENTEPEIKRCNLASAVLLLKASGVHDVLRFDYMDRPTRTSLIRALEQLYALGALSDNGDLTELGKKMAEFPLDPMYSKALFESQKSKCTQDIIAIISLLSVDGVFFSPHDKRAEAAEAKKKFISRDGDHITLLNVLTSYLSVNGDRDWCRENFINMRAMKHVMDVRKQLTQLCTRLNISPTTTCGQDYDVVLKCFLTGFFQNTALLQPDGGYKTVVGGMTVHIHPASVMFGKKVEAIVYNELVFTTKHYLRGISAIQANWLPQAAPKYFDNVQVTQ